MSRKNVTIGLFGFGCVGLGLYEVLQKTPGLRARVKKIGIKHPEKPRPLAAEYFTTDPAEIIDDDEINVVVELIDDADAAFGIVKTALQKGKAVVTANKKMLAEHFTELLELQRIHNVPLLYEAACCASIPIIRNLEEYYDNDLLDSVEGIVNGSTNYILSKTATEHISYAEALKQAQEKGYAESDPTLDTGGFDARYKLLILVAHAFGLVLQPADIYNRGIDGLGELELNYAREKGLKIKLIAHAHKSPEGKVRSFVLPKFVAPEDRLFAVDDVFNGVKTQSCFSDTQFFSGRGAGAHPTASAVLSDISALTYDYRYEYKKLQQSAQAEAAGDLRLKVLLRHGVEEQEQYRAYFSRVDESFLNHRSGYIIGDISLEKLKEAGRDENVSVVVKEVYTN